MRNYWAIKILKGIVFVTLGILLFGYITMHLWNWLVPALFSGPVITMSQAFGILILSKILFGGFKGGRWGGGCHCGSGRGYWRDKWEMKTANMSPEEKEKFRQGFYGKCGEYWEKKGTDNE